MRGYDLLTTLDDARRWVQDPPAVARAGLSPTDLAAGDLALLRSVREQLRAVLTTPADSPSAPDPTTDALGQVPLILEADGHGATVLAPSSGSPLFAGTIVTAAANPSAEAWSRLHACDALDCRWVSYDTSRSRSRRWARPRRPSGRRAGRAR